MKIYLEKAIFVNRAPFEKLELDFNENEIAVLSAVNGRGKTTIISHIVDAFYEIAKPNFQNEFKDKPNDFYRISSGIYNLDQGQPSFVYFRFKLAQTEESSTTIIDYIDISGACTEAQYNDAILLHDKIQFVSINSQLVANNNVKYVSLQDNGKTVKSIFTDNVMTYFPAYRYEQPGYMTQPYEIQLDFSKKSEFIGYMKNPIEVRSGLVQLTNWILDVILDNQYLNVTVNDIRVALPSVNQYVAQASSCDLNSYILENLADYIFSAVNISSKLKSQLQTNLNTILNGALKSKHKNNLRFGIGARNAGGTRIQVMNAENNNQVYPSIFNISSGEASMLCLFGEILRQADKLKNNILLDEITGIVLIDEVDKHLHIKLQKEVLPTLFNLLPNVQFILSSHSPFLSMGLAEKSETLHRTRIIDLDNFGISKDPATNELYQDVYSMMIGENERFKELFQELEDKIKQGTKPLIITEGKTDRQHIMKAKEKLGNTLDVEFHQVPDNFGDSNLKQLLEQIAKIYQSRKVIGIFDRDIKDTILDIEKDNRDFKSYGNNVFAFCIPVPTGKEIYTNISIEFYYDDKDLKKIIDGKRLYFDNEVHFIQSASNKKDRKLSKSEDTDTEHEAAKKIFDENIGGLGWIHSKGCFAELVESDLNFIADFNFDKFKLIFERLQLIIAV